MDPRQMANSDGRRVNRPYRKASEYLSTRQGMYEGPKTLSALENENAELREKLTTSIRRMETMEVEFQQSREYFSTQLDVATDKSNRNAQALKLMQQSYSELQSINYELEQRVLKVNQLENERTQLISDVHELTNKLTDTRSSLQKMQKENERLRKDCNLAVSLLECNAGNFKHQRVNQLAPDLQNRVEEYQMDISQYNEYINPYAADSDSEGESHQFSQPSDTIPTGLLANVLKKPENVHLKLEDTDYIRDPDLNSVYKGQIAEKKLVKYDYEETPEHYGKSATVPRSLNNNNKQGQFRGMSKSSSGVQSSGQSSSPWELAPTTASSTNSSPWELSSNPPIQNDYDADDFSAASAYGAYPVSYRKPAPNRRNQPQINSGTPSVKKSSYNKTKMSSSYNVATSPSLRKPSGKGTGENKDVYISDNFKQQQDGASRQVPSTTGSGQSSRKSTPAKVVTDNERGSNAEKSSLLDQEGTDDEDIVMTIELGGRGPPRVGMATSGGVYKGSEMEGQGLLQKDSDPEPDERDLDDESDAERGNYDVEADSREQEEEGNMREAVNHNMPEVNLLNLEDNIEALPSPKSSPLQEFMMHKTVLGDVIIPATLLPNLPPPSEQQHDGELILCEELQAPPPPDMFGGGPTNQIPIYAASDFENQSPPMPSRGYPTQLTPSTTGTSSTMSQPPSSLDDLNMCVHKELESAKSPVKTTPSSLPTTQKEVPAPSSVQGTEEILEATENPNRNPQTYQDETIASSSGQSFQDDASNDEVAGEILRIDSPEKDFLLQNIDDHESLEEKPGGVSSPESAEESSNVEQGLNLSENGENFESQNHRKSASGGNRNFGRSEPYDAQTSDNEVVITALSQEQLTTSDEPLEVLELQEEPRGGNYNRRRRNSFDQAREFGSVLDS